MHYVRIRSNSERGTAILFGHIARIAFALSLRDHIPDLIAVCKQGLSPPPFTKKIFKPREAIAAAIVFVVSKRNKYNLDLVAVVRASGAEIDSVQACIVKLEEKLLDV
jgi:hypothetical protein